jgi:hypothetical protein
MTIPEIRYLALMPIKLTAFCFQIFYFQVTCVSFCPSLSQCLLKWHPVEFNSTSRGTSPRNQHSPTSGPTPASAASILLDKFCLLNSICQAQPSSLKLLSRHRASPFLRYLNLKTLTSNQVTQPDRHSSQPFHCPPSD